MVWVVAEEEVMKHTWVVSDKSTMRSEKEEVKDTVSFVMVVVVVLVVALNKDKVQVVIGN